MNATVYHNPRCSKSRAALQLLEQLKVNTRVIEYLKTPPDESELRTLLQQLDLKPAELLRRGEKVFRELELGEQLDDDSAVITAMLENPVLIERPIIVIGDQAVIGRPPERLQELLDQ